MGLVSPKHVGFSWTRSWTHVRCNARGILNHWTTREVPGMHLNICPTNRYYHFSLYAISRFSLVILYILVYTCLKKNWFKIHHSKNKDHGIQSHHFMANLLFSLSVMSDSLQPPCICSMPGFLDLHHLQEFAQIHVHWVSDNIQPSCPLSSPSLPSFSFPASGSFPVSQFFTSGGQSTGASASASALPMNI